jgi:hypothetical protein
MIDGVLKMAEEEKSEEKKEEKEKGRLGRYFDDELVSTTFHTITGIIAGYLSFLANSAGLSFLIMIVILVISFAISKFSLKLKKDAKWWLGNGGIIVYIIVWLVVWTIFYNLALR